MPIRTVAQGIRCQRITEDYEIIAQRCGDFPV